MSMGRATRTSIARSRWPHFLPDGNRFLYFVAADHDSVQGIYVASLQSPRGRRLTYASGSAVFSNGYLLFYRDIDVYAQRFNPSNVTLSGRAELVLKDVAASTTHQAAFSVSNTGDLIYSAGNAKDMSRFVSVNVAGAKLSELTPAQRQSNPNLSFDGARLAFELYQGTDSDIAILDLASQRVQRLAHQTIQATLPVWSPTEHQLVYVVEESAGWGLYIWHPDQSGEPRRVFLSPHAIIPAQWTIRNEILIARRGDNGYDVFALQLRDPNALTPVLTAEGHQLNPELSPSAKRLAYVSSTGGDYELVVEDYPLRGHRCQISTAGTNEPHWGATDSTLFFLQGTGELMLANIPMDGSCPRRPPVVLMNPGLGNTSTAPSHYVVQRRAGTFTLNVPDG